MNITDLSIHQSIKQYLQENGITQLTAIQEQAIPKLLTDRGDAHGKAQTGTGKTLAFLIPLLERVLKSQQRGVKGLIVSPTRELALQISEVAQPLAKTVGLSVATVYGGVSIEDQIKKLKKGADIVIGTPGRIKDHLYRGTMKLSYLETLILDEADIMLDMGFREEIVEILQYTPKEREIWLFSATVKEGIDYIKNKYMNDPFIFDVKQKTVTTELTQQYFCVVQQKDRVRALSRFIEVADSFYGLVFCQTKVLTQDVAEKLNRYGYKVGALHGDMSQSQRNVITKKFRNKQLHILVATDVAARGIDIQDLTHVVNFSFPEDHESYVHRIGRTGRAGKEGTAITFIDKKDLSLIRRIQKKFKISIEPVDVPTIDDVIQNRMQTIQQFVARSTDNAHPQYQQLQELVNSLSEDQVRSTLYAVLYQRYIEPIARESISSMSEQDINNELKTQELSLTVGSLDGVDREQVKKHVLRVANISARQLKKVRVIQRKTFIEVAADVARTVQKALHNSRVGGRTVRAHMVD